MTRGATLKDKWRAVPKSWETVALEASPVEIPTYNALGEYANNTTAEGRPMLRTLIKVLGIAFMSIQRHIKRLSTLGLIEILKRRRDERGCFLGYRLRLVAHLAAAGGRIEVLWQKNHKAYYFYYEEQKKEPEAKQRKARRIWQGPSVVALAGFTRQASNCAAIVLEEELECKLLHKEGSER